MSHPRAVITPAEPRTYELDSVRFKVVREVDPRRRHQLSTPDSVVSFIRAAGLLPDDAREHFSILMLSTQNGFIAHHEVSTGTLSASLVSAREVFGPALRIMGVSSIILIHNHPSGDPTPSPEDVRLTRQLGEAAKLLDMRIHDHLIFGDGTDAFVSLAQRGVI